MDNDFERDMIDRTARIETKLDIILETQAHQQTKLDAVEETALKAMDSTKSAHKRIDGIKQTAIWLAGAVSTAVGVLIGLAELYLQSKRTW